MYRKKMCLGTLLVGWFVSLVAMEPVNEPIGDNFPREFYVHNQAIARLEPQIVNSRRILQRCRNWGSYSSAAVAGLASMAAAAYYVPFKARSTQLPAACLITFLTSLGTYLTMKCAKCFGFFTYVTSHHQNLASLKSELSEHQSRLRAVLALNRAANLEILRPLQERWEPIEREARMVHERCDQLRLQVDALGVDRQRAQRASGLYRQDAENLVNRFDSLQLEGQSQHDVHGHQIECPICLTECNVEELVRLECGHISCRGCLQRQVQTAIYDHSVAGFVCPDPMCLVSSGNQGQRRTRFTADDIEDIILGLPEDQERNLRDSWGDLMRNDCLQRSCSNGLKQCPGADCTFQWTYVPTEGAADAWPVTCEACRENHRPCCQYCVNCRLPWRDHQRGGNILNCSDAQRYHEIIERETPEGRADREAREEAIRHGGFYCANPAGCNNVIERQAGCDHMLCGRDTHGHGEVRGCGYDFCIRCMLPWQGHGVQWHGGGCAGALQYHVNRGHRWALELRRWISAEPRGRTAADGMEHWMQFCNERGRENVFR